MSARDAYRLCDEIAAKLTELRAFLSSLGKEPPAEKPFVCPFCQLGFSLADLVRDHAANVHGVATSDAPASLPKEGS